jgi:hypothetical protein
MTRPTFPDNQKSYRYVPRYVGSNFDLWAWQVTQSVNGLLDGFSNNTGEVTLTENSATSTVTLPHGVLSDNSVILFMPTTSNAAVELASGAMYVSARSVTNRFDSNSTFTITHTNNAQTDRTFKYVLVG